VSSLLCLDSARHLGATFDEPFYIQKGLDYWRTGNLRDLMRAGTMPLPVQIQTLPLSIWESLHGERFDSIGELDRLLPIARAANLPFWWLLLWSTRWLARQWGGRFASQLAVGLIGFEPNLLAHAALATTDIAATATVTAFLAAVLNGTNRCWRDRVLIPGLVAGLALACKASALTFLPLLFLALRFPISRREWFDAIAMALIAFVALFVAVGSNWRTEPSFVAWSQSLPATLWAESLRWLASNLAIFPNAGEGLVQQIKHNIRGHGCFVLGQYHTRAVWYYFPVVFAMKLPEVVLVGLVPAAFLQRRSELVRLIVALGLFSLLCRVQIGLRLLFPLVVLISLLMAVSIANAKRWQVLASAILLIGVAWSMASWHPHGLMHRNRFWGAPEASAEQLADSNADWGQGLPELRDWHEANGRPPMTVWYGGADPAILSHPFRIVQLNQHPVPSLDVLKRATQQGGVFALSANLRIACPDRRPETLAVLDELNAMTPIARTRTFWIYRW